MEKNNNKNVFLRSGLTLFALTLVSVWSLSGIYAKYCKTGSAEDAARAASFSVAAAGEKKAKTDFLRIIGSHWRTGRKRLSHTISR